MQTLTQHPSLSHHLRDLVSACLVSDHRQRPSARDLLDHPFVALRREWTAEQWSALLDLARAPGVAKLPLAQPSISISPQDLKQLAMRYMENAFRRKLCKNSPTSIALKHTEDVESLLPPEDRLVYLSSQV